MAEYTYVLPNTVSKVPNAFLSPGTPIIKIGVRTVPKREKPSVPQFSGTLFPAREVMVSLQRSNRQITETVWSDVNGYFEFTGWYAPHADYEFFVHGDDLYKPEVFVVDTPIEHRWNGRPSVVDSTDLS